MGGERGCGEGWTCERRGKKRVEETVYYVRSKAQENYVSSIYTPSCEAIGSYWGGSGHLRTPVPPTYHRPPS